MTRPEGTGTTGVGELIRRWRRQRRKSQMELAFDAGFSARHVSFVETGRARPSRKAVLAIADALDVPLRDRNAMLEAAGHARAWSEVPFEAEERSHLRATVDRILERQEPWFAVAVDHRWDVLAANAPAEATLTGFFEEGRVPGPRNLFRMTLHPDGLRPAILNLDAVAPRLLRALRLDVARRPEDTALAELLAEMEGYGVPSGADAPGPVPLVLATPFGTARLLTLVMDFANPLDPVMEDIRVETFLPADEESAAVLAAGREAARGGTTGYSESTSTWSSS